METLLIIVVIVVGVFYIGMPLIQFLMLLYYKFQVPTIQSILRKDVPEEVAKLIYPYEKVLFEKGFVRGSVLEHNGALVGGKHRIFVFDYYHPQTYVHALLETQPYVGSLQPVRVMFESIYKNGNIAVTENGMKHFLFVEPEGVKIHDHYLPNWEEVYERHLEDRRDESKEITASRFDDEGLKAYLDHFNVINQQAYMDKGLTKQTDYGFRFVPSLKTWRASQEMVHGQKQFRKILQAKQHRNDDEDIKSRIATVMTRMDVVGKKRGESNPIVWFVGSVVAFVLLYGILGFELLDIAVIVVVLLIHELGHYFAMRYFGYSDTSIFFLPFGAVTLGQKEKRSAWEEYAVSLAGPLPGIILGVGLIAWQVWQTWGAQGFQGHNNAIDIHFFALMSIVINYINLLPIYPLDGGRIVQILFLLRYPRVQFYFYLLSIGVLSAAMLYWQDWLLLIFIIILAAGFHQNRALARVLKRIDLDNADKATIAKAVVEDEKYSGATLEFQAKVANHVQHIVQTGKPSKRLVFFGGLLYIILLAPPVVTAAYIYNDIHSSAYGKLSSEQKEEVTRYYDTLGSYDGLVAKGDLNLSMDDAMQRLDRFFHEQNISQPEGATASALEGTPCPLTDGLQRLYLWHDGVKMLLGDEDVLSITKMKEEYAQWVKASPESEIDWMTLTIPDYAMSLVMFCGKEGLYRYDAIDEPIKAFYDTAHMLQVYADLFEAKGFIKGDDGTLYVKPSLLIEIERRYMLPEDKKRYEEKIAFLKKKAREYQDNGNEYFRWMVVWSMSRMNDKRLIEELKLYVDDEDEEIAESARYTIREIEDL